MGKGLLIIEASRWHSDTPKSVGLLWRSDQPTHLTKHNSHKRQIYLPPVGFEPSVAASERRLLCFVILQI